MEETAANALAWTVLVFIFVEMITVTLTPVWIRIQAV